MWVFGFQFFCCKNWVCGFAWWDLNNHNNDGRQAGRQSSREWRRAGPRSGCCSCCLPAVECLFVFPPHCTDDFVQSVSDSSYIAHHHGCHEALSLSLSIIIVLLLCTQPFFSSATIMKLFSQRVETRNKEGDVMVVVLILFLFLLFPLIHSIQTPHHCARQRLSPSFLPSFLPLRKNCKTLTPGWTALLLPHMSPSLAILARKNYNSLFQFLQEWSGFVKNTVQNGGKQRTHARTHAHIYFFHYKLHSLVRKSIPECL